RKIKAVGIRAKLDGALEQRGTGARTEAAVEERTSPVRDDARRIEIIFGAEAIARGARAVGGIEAEGARLELRDGNAAVGAGQLFGGDMVLAADNGDGNETGGELEGGGDGLLEARGDALFDEKAIDDDFDGVVLALVESRGSVEGVELAVDAHANEAVLCELFQLLAVGAFATAHDRGEDHDAVVGLAEVAVKNGLHNLVAGLAGDGLAASGAMRNADGTVDDTEIVVNFGDGADGGTRRARGRLLLDGDGGGEALDDVDFGALHLVEELAGVGGEGLHVATLALGVNGVKGKGGFAGAGKAGDDGEGVAGDFDADIFEIVLARAADYEFRQAHDPQTLPPQEPACGNRQALAPSG